VGTRNLTAVMSDGEYRIAQYGQWDGHPESSGVTVLDFCRKRLRAPKGQQHFRNQLSLCRFLTDKEQRALPSDWKDRHPQLSRDMGADILEFVASAKDNVVLINTIDFAGDSVSCEWAYVIDLDKGTLEVFKGFNTDASKVAERFKSQPIEPTRSGRQYYQVSAVAGFALGNLPTTAEFLAAVGRDEE